jgi:hypothetical protein
MPDNPDYDNIIKKKYAEVKGTGSKCFKVMDQSRGVIKWPY